MKRKIIAVILTVCFMLASFSVGFSATEITHIEPEEYYEYIQYSFETKEYTNIRVPVDKSISHTWQLFEPSQIAAMTLARQSSLSNNPDPLRDSVMPFANLSNLSYTPPTTQPYCSVVLIRTFFYDFDTDSHIVVDSTGFLVSDKVVVCSGHAIIPGGYDEIEEIRVYYDLDKSSDTPNSNEAFIGEFFVSVEEYTYSSQYNSSPSTYDYAVLELQAPISRPFYFDCVESSYLPISTNVSVSGYPGKFIYYQYTGSGSVYFSDYYVARSTNYIEGTMSGGPLYDNLYCYGIATYGVGSNSSDVTCQSNLFTTEIFNLICDKIEANR